MSNQGSRFREFGHTVLTTTSITCCSHYCTKRFLGLVVYHFPIEDGMIPTSVSALNRLLVKIRKRIADGNRVLIHCYGKILSIKCSPMRYIQLNVPYHLWYSKNIWYTLNNYRWSRKSCFGRSMLNPCYRCRCNSYRSYISDEVVKRT